MHAMAQVRRSKESILSVPFYMSSGDQTQVARPVWQTVYLLISTSKEHHDFGVIPKKPYLSKL